MTKTAKTQAGKTVVLGKTVPVEGGTEGYVLHPRTGYAVKVFIPAK